MNPIMTILILALIVATFAAFRPTLTRIGVEQEHAAIKAAIMEGSMRVDYNIVCRGDAGEELAKLAAQYGNCKK